MLGAIIGDIAGSVWEFRRPRPAEIGWPLFPDEAGFTDDSLLTLAVGQALMDAGGEVGRGPMLVAAALRQFASMYRLQRGGYGAGFFKWLASETPQPYGSSGNGSAMRVSAAGWLYPSLEATERWAGITATVSHNHPDGVAGAQATAAAIFLARTGHTKDDIAAYITRRFGYDLDRTWEQVMSDDPDGMKPDKMLAAKTVPEAILAFLGARGFEDTIRRAVSVGGDTDTRAAIAGSIAEAYWGIPCHDMRDAVTARLPEPLAKVLNRFEQATIAQRLVALLAPLNHLLFDSEFGGPKDDQTQMATGRFAGRKPVSVDALEPDLDSYGLMGYESLVFEAIRRPGANLEACLDPATVDAPYLASLLVWHIRSERFVDGISQIALRDGSLAAIARRAYELAGMTNRVGTSNILCSAAATPITDLS
jgi:ADP-ribosylglycohydrolase